MSDSQFLVAVLDRLLPPNDDLPGAGRMGLDAVVLEESRKTDANQRALSFLLDGLPDDFLDLDGAAQDDALRALESQDNMTFFAMIVMTYNAYYTDDRVLQLIEKKTGYAARPPQPQGYELEPFDESILENIRKREPFYRKI